MQIAVFSDTHDNLDTTKIALEQVKAKGITHALHLGDFTSPPTIMLLAESGLQWTCVWGNCDGDKLLSYRRVEHMGTMDFANGDFRGHEVGGKKLFLTHYPEIARIAALSGQYDAVFHGHNHQAATETVGKTLLANPGELTGIRFGMPSYGIYTPEENTFEIIWL
jgi:putative phosphoesterase